MSLTEELDKVSNTNQAVTSDVTVYNISRHQLLMSL